MWFYIFVTEIMNLKVSREAPAKFKNLLSINGVKCWCKNGMKGGESISNEDKKMIWIIFDCHACNTKKVFPTVRTSSYEQRGSVKSQLLPFTPSQTYRGFHFRTLFY